MKLNISLVPGAYAVYLRLRRSSSTRDYKLSTGRLYLYLLKKQIERNVFKLCDLRITHRISFAALSERTAPLNVSLSNLTLSISCTCLYTMMRVM